MNNEESHSASEFKPEQNVASSSNAPSPTNPSSDSSKTQTFKSVSVLDPSAQGTVIMPRINSAATKRSSSILDLSQSAILTRAPLKSGDSSVARKDSHARLMQPLTPEEEADLINQQTVISQRPFADPDPMRTLTTREMGRILTGHTLGNYSLIEFVGGGGMGAVFRATDTLLNRTVAIKVLAPSQARDEETLRRFKNEAQSAARLDHENIGRVYNVGEDQGWHYIIFEFIEGENLRDFVLRQGPLSLVDNLTLLTQLADALAHASSREVVHRDIKPSNVIITPEGRAKLVDMGLARLHQVDEDKEDLTASGVTLGTFDYISPEQARDPRLADVRSDIYSLGCTLYFMLTGRPPFPKGTVLQKLLSHQADLPPDPRLERNDLPDDFLHILQRMMAKAPESRYQTPEELHADLRTLGTAVGLEDLSHGKLAWGSPAPLPLPQAWWYRHLPWMIPLAVSIVVMLGAQLFSFGESESPQHRLLDIERGQPTMLNSPATKSAPIEPSPNFANEPDGRFNFDTNPQTLPPKHIYTPYDQESPELLREPNSRGSFQPPQPSEKKN